MTSQYEEGDDVIVNDAYEATVEAVDEKAGVVVVSVAVGPAGVGIREKHPDDVELAE